MLLDLDEDEQQKLLDHYSQSNNSSITRLSAELGVDPQDQETILQKFNEYEEDVRRQLSNQFGIDPEEQKRLLELYESSTELSAELGVDKTEQHRLVEQFEAEKMQGSLSSLSTSDLTPPASSPQFTSRRDNTPSMVDVAPGVRLPLLSAEEQLEKLIAGQVVVTQCISCQQELTCAEDAEYLLCDDCWVCSPIESSDVRQQVGAFSRRGVCIGYRTDDLLKLLSQLP